MREPPSFTLEVPAVGDFVVRRMSPGLRFRIEAAVEKACLGIAGELLRRAIRAFTFVEHVTAGAPDGFVLEEMDPTDPMDFARVLLVEEAYLAEDARFRGRSWPPREGDRPGPVADGRVPLPA